jgi:hypothetical protein
MMAMKAIMIVCALLAAPIQAFRIQGMKSTPRARLLSGGVSCSSSRLKYMGNDEVDSMIQNPERFRRRMFVGRAKEFEKVDRKRSLNAVENLFGRVFMVIFMVDIVREYVTGHCFMELIANDLGLQVPGL